MLFSPSPHCVSCVALSVTAMTRLAAEIVHTQTRKESSAAMLTRQLVRKRPCVMASAPGVQTRRAWLMELSVLTGKGPLLR